MIKHFFSFFLLLLSPAFYAATYTVNSTDDVNDGTCDGVHCSLREAINAANANVGIPDIIEFSTSGTITLTTTLPILTDNAGVTIDGYANSPGGATPNTNATGALNGTLTIVLDGATNNLSIGLMMSGSNNIIKGLVFSGFGDGTPSSNDFGIVSASTGNQILGCYIGTNAAGTVAAGRTYYGIGLSNANNIIGDGTPEGRNLISGIDNTIGSTGIYLTGANAQNTTIKGNIIGLAADGVTRLNGNSYGVYITSSANNNTIGGIGAGDGNLISGNGSKGVYIESTHVNGNSIIGNTVGTQAGGLLYVTGNTQIVGIEILNSPNNIMGGNTANHRNVISGNTGGAGISIIGASATGNSVKGNYIGIGANGSSYITGSNQISGVSILTNASKNTIGGTAAGEENVISGNTSFGGVYIDTDAHTNYVYGNIIGPQADGVSFLASSSQATGVQIGFFASTSHNNIIGSAVGSQQIISGNLTGITINPANSTGNSITNNYIGVAGNGTSVIAGANQSVGVYVFGGESNTISNNVISGNTTAGNSGIGISLSTSATGGTTITGNIIGPQADGSANLSAAQATGIEISNSQNHVIGGDTPAERNIISANRIYGVLVTGATATGNTIKGNYIGLASDGETYIASSRQGHGVALLGNSSYTTIGGSVAGEGNLISGAGWSGAAGTPAPRNGILISASNYNTILGNIIGLQHDGETFVTNNDQNNGIHLYGGSSYNIIGGTGANEKNIISGNNTNGILFANAIATTGPNNNSIIGNYVGIASDGITYVTSQSQNQGINLNVGFDNIIGGNGAGEGNLISGNETTGLRLGTAWNTTVQGNIIGPQADGNTYVTGNVQTTGIQINNRDNTIGGSSAGEENVISANETYGIHILNANATGNSIKGNIIGLASDGASAIGSATQDYGVYITTNANRNTIGGSAAGEGNVISGNKAAAASSGIGIYCNSTNTNGNTIIGNIIGPQSDGNTWVNAWQADGIHIDGSLNNTIGGNDANKRNVISANEARGIYITGAAATGNTILGNYIGIAANGTSYITNSNQDYGIYIANSPSFNTIGGDRTANEGNVISANTTVGVNIEDGCNSNTILGNTVGPRSDGTAIVAGATQNGIGLKSDNNVVGGNSAAYRNIISGNANIGLFFNPTADNNSVKGNYIGISSNGTSLLASSSQVWGIIGTAGSGNSIGGSAAGEGNVISGNMDGTGDNGRGIYLLLTSNYTVVGNIIGPQADGNTHVTNNGQVHGIYLEGGTNGTIIGGNTAGHRNVISANKTYGVYLTGATTINNEVKGNYIGTNAAGTGAIGSSSQNYGVYITGSANSNTIGGTAANEGNLISGQNDGSSTAVGIFTNSDHVNGNTFLGNTIGTQAGGLLWLNNNQQKGIEINASPNNVIGNTVAVDKNVISANGEYGIYITGATSTGTVIKSNYIGVGSTGTNFIGSNSQDYGIFFDTDAPATTIGGTGISEGNVISGNRTTGIHAVTSSGHTIVGNVIGAAASGTLALSNTSNQTTGIYLEDSPDNIIGGNTAAYRNVISDNLTFGLNITGTSSTGNVIQGNYIGIAQDGATFITSSSQDRGINIQGGATLTTIGGPGAGEGNVISGANGAATASGIFIFNVADATSEHTIQGNIIGPQADGETFVTGHGQVNGIYLSNSYDNVIGGSAAGEGNTISANSTRGIYIQGGSATGNVLQGNYIGLASDGSSEITGADDQDYGVHISAAPNNQIGGDAGVDDANPEGNIIAFNTVDGILIDGAAASGNLVSKTIIYSNTGKAINLNGTGNADYDSPTVDRTFTSTVITGTAQNGDIIQVFKNASGDCQDAPVFLGSTTANGSGDWTFNSTVSLAAGETPTATARHSTNNNTSEFACPDWVGLPISLLSFSAVAIDNSYTQLNWQTATEIKNDYFTVEASLDPSKDDWRVVDTVLGAGNSSTVLSYSLADYNIPATQNTLTLYYRLKQTDLDGAFSYSKTIAVNFYGTNGNSDFTIFPNPANSNDISVFISGNINDNVQIIIRDILGKELYHNNFVLSATEYTIKLSNDFVLAQGMYTISVSTNNKTLSKKLIVK